MIITIDGPASVGKGTLASKIAEFYGFAYFDTGMVYRAVGLEVLLNNKDINNEKTVANFASTLTLEKIITLSSHPLFRSPKGGTYASIAASYPKVRKILLKPQQDFALKNPNSVYDGRDTGTEVCPNADLKIFITASSEIRAMRRYKEFIAKGIETTYEQVLKDVKERDDRDTNRPVAPLKPAKDAIIVDNSDLNIEQTFEKLKTIVDSKMEKQL